MTTGLLGFDTPVYNSIAAQMGRGKCEMSVASALAAVALTLNKFAADCIFYMNPSLGFIRFPDELTTGSSIMPHKKNPDVWETVRARCNQLLKEILFPALEWMHDCLKMTGYMLQCISVNKHIFDNPLYETLFTVEEVNRRALSGTPFREAYRQVGIEVNEGNFHFTDPSTGLPADISALKASDLGHTHLGSLGNLCTKEIAAVMEAAAAW